MMNVASTRTKQEFYIIGDRSLYKSLRSTAVDVTNDVICEYKEEHPELAKDETAVKQRKTGEITRECDGSRTKYVCISCDDGPVQYTINESLYAKIKDADLIIRKGNHASFFVTPPTSVNGKNVYLTDENITKA